jgi:hypothetical protein
MALAQEVIGEGKIVSARVTVNDRGQASVMEREIGRAAELETRSPARR